MLIALALTGLSTFPMPVLGSTYVVDDQAGPGVDFTTIQSAFDAASPGDVVIVQAGTHAGATLTKGLRVVGQGLPLLTGSLRVLDLPVGPVAVIADLRVVDYQRFEIARCAGVVVAVEVRAREVDVEASFDVRLRGISAGYQYVTLSTRDSRVEVVESFFNGADGIDQYCSPWYVNIDAETAASVSGGELHAARSSFRGGIGGDWLCPDPIEYPGWGGNGIFAGGASTYVLLSGTSANSVVGNPGGSTYYPDSVPNGFGLRLWNASSARVSGLAIGSTQVDSTSTLTTATPTDPTLRMLEVPAAGVNLTFRLNAPAGASAQMRIGALPVVHPSGGPGEDVLVARASTFALGAVPANGIVGFNYPIPATWQRGTTVFAQAVVTYPGGEQRQTHSVPIVVR